MSNTIQSLWQHQEPELRRLSIDEIQRRADQALMADHEYKRIPLVIAAILVACFAIFFLASQTLTGRIGAAVGIGAGLSIAWRARRLSEMYPLLPSASGMAAYRRILEREQKALSICWQTMLVVQLGVILQFLGDPQPNARQALTAVATVAPVVLVAFLTRAKAQAYGRRARDLASL